MTGVAGRAASAEYRLAVEALFALKPRGPKLGIDRMRLLVDELKHPERALPVVHIGGTNGKGSVAAMIDAILRRAGFKVGLYTSPHLVDVGERVQVDRRNLAPARFLELLAELRPIAERIARRHGEESAPSFFEYMTAMALLEFRRERCDLAVIEVGMGGEFDATNVVVPEVSVLTSVGLDHCEWLGRTVEAIARTKAGIIKPRRPVVIGRLPNSAETIVREIASWHEAPVRSVRDAFGDDVSRYPQTNLAGEFQRWNAATATLAIQLLPPPWRVPDDTITSALTSVSWPGRWEETRVGGHRVILDASHNPDGATALAGNLAQLRRQTGRPPIVVVGVLGTERAAPLLATIAEFAGEIHLVVPQQPRACSQAELSSLVPAAFAGRVVRSNVADIFPGRDTCTVGEAGVDVVVVTGSIYLLGEVMARLQPRG